MYEVYSEDEDGGIVMYELYSEDGKLFRRVKKADPVIMKQLELDLRPVEDSKNGN